MSSSDESQPAASPDLGPRFAALVEYSSDIITLLDATGTIRYASPAVARILGYPAETNVGNSVFNLIHPDDGERVRAALADLNTRPDGVERIELRLEMAGGRWCHVESIASNRMSDPAVRGIVVNSRDVTEQVAAMEALIHAAHHDPLTGLPNRTLLVDRLGHALARAGRSRREVAVLFLDLDGFKAVNDRFGHRIGDEVLVETGRRLLVTVRESDTVARQGGDELVVVAEDLAMPEEAIGLAHRLLEEIGRPFPLSGATAEISACAGVAVSAHAAPEVMIDAADTALYQAKTEGPASVVLRQVHEPP